MSLDQPQFTIVIEGGPHDGAVFTIDKIAHPALPATPFFGVPLHGTAHLDRYSVKWADIEEVAANANTMKARLEAAAEMIRKMLDEERT